MQAIREFYERKLNFVRCDNNDVSRLRMFLLDDVCYRSEIGSYNGSIYGKVKSFLHQLASKHASTEHEGYRYDSSWFDIGIMINPGEDNLEFKKLITFRVEPRGDVLDFEEINLAQFEPHSAYPMQIYIDAKKEYKWDEVESESEFVSEDENDNA